MKIFSLQEVLEEENLDSCLLLMGLTGKAGGTIKREIDAALEKKGTQMRCVSYEKFMRREFPAIVNCHYNKIFVHSLSLIVTETCTLRCKKCAIMLPHFKKKTTYSLEELKRNVDLAFQKIDYIGDFTVTGGEPLLFPQLDQVLAYIGSHYRERIGSFKIITNGTILSSSSLLSVLKEQDVSAEISDYTNGVPAIRGKVEELVRILQENGIRFQLLSSAQWVDFGIGGPERAMDSQDLAAFFEYCNTNCRGYVNGEIWYCINAGFAEKALERSPDPNNRLLLEEIGEELSDRRKIVEFDQPKGIFRYVPELQWFV